MAIVTLRHDRKHPIVVDVEGAGAVSRWDDLVDQLMQRGFTVDDLVDASVRGGPLMDTSNSYKFDDSSKLPAGLSELGLTPWAVGSRTSRLVPVEAAFHPLEPVDVANPTRLLLPHAQQTYRTGTKQDLDERKLWKNTKGAILPRGDNSDGYRYDRPFYSLITGISTPVRSWSRKPPFFSTVPEEPMVDVKAYTMGSDPDRKARVPSHRVKCRVDAHVRCVVRNRLRLFPIELKRRSAFAGGVVSDITALQIFLYGWGMRHVDLDYSRFDVNPILVVLDDQPWGTGRFYRFSTPTAKGPTAMSVVASGAFAPL